MQLPNHSTLPVKAFWTETDAQDLVEYSLLLGFVSITAIALLSGWKSSLLSIWGKLVSDLSSAS
jgi:Flp pilus assembly pilin Flp